MAPRRCGIHSIDTIFCLTMICMPNPDNSKRYYIFSMGPQKQLNWHCATRLGIGALKLPFQVKLTKMPLVNPGLTKRQIWVKITPKQHFSFIYIKHELLNDIHQLWPTLTQSWLSRAPKTLISIRPSEWVGTNIITKIIKFPFQWLFIGLN